MRPKLIPLRNLLIMRNQSNGFINMIEYGNGNSGTPIFHGNEKQVRVWVSLESQGSV